MKTLRKMAGLRLTDKVRNQEIRKRLGVKSVEMNVSGNVQRGYDHAIRMMLSRLTNRYGGRACRRRSQDIGRHAEDEVGAYLEYKRLG